MAIQNEGAFNAVRQFVEEAHPLVTEKGRVISFPSEEWAREGQNFVRRPAVRTFLDLGELSEELHALPSFAAAVETLRADERIAPKFGEAMIGTLFFSQALSPEQVLDTVLHDALLDEADIRLDPERIEAAYERTERFLYSDETSFSVVAPLEGLSLAQTPLELGAGITVDRLTDDELNRCVRANLLQPMGGLPVLGVGEIVGVRIVRTLPRFAVGEGEAEVGMEERLEEAQRLFDEFSAIVERVVQGVRLLKSGPFGSPGYIYYDTEEYGGEGTGWVPRSISLKVRHAHLALDDGECEALRELWGGLTSEHVRGHTRLQAALRRFGYAGERDRSDDGLVDLMVAAEALFLPRERQELAYKLSMRSAFFLKSEGLDARSTFDLVKRAYSARSQIVHGATLTDLKLPDGTHVTLDEFVEHTEAILRAAIVKAVRVLSGAEQGSLDHLDDPVFAG